MTLASTLIPLFVILLCEMLSSCNEFKLILLLMVAIPSSDMLLLEILILCNVVFA